ncbi:MAG: hypothetical protein ACYS74_01605 [Planctomycetota bacterium]|jgi:hypothetical protein
MENLRDNAEQRFVPAVREFLARVGKALQSRYVPVLLSAVAAIIMLPALNAGSTG